MTEVKVRESADILYLSINSVNLIFDIWRELVEHVSYH